jgi:hypothetical protein
VRSACEVAQKRYVRGTRSSRNVLRSRRWHSGPTETEVRAHEGANRGRSPQGVGVAVAAIDEATSELLERASFLQDLEKA